MQFLSDVYLRCPDSTDAATGRNSSKPIAPEEDRQRALADVLDMTVSESVDYFAAYPDVLRTLRPLAEVGLEYLRLASRCRLCPAARRNASNSPAI